MKYNIEKINEIGKLLAEVVEDAIKGEGQAEVLIGEVEMVLRESLREVGRSALKSILENGAGEVETEIECACGGKLKYQRRRAATIWSVFGKVVYRRVYYAGCACGQGQAPVDSRYGIEPGKVTAGLAHLIALSGIQKAFEEGRKWLKEYLLFEVSENTVRAETQKMGELQRQAEAELVQTTQDEFELQKRERSQPPAPDLLYGSIDAAKVRIEPRHEKEKATEDREIWRDMKVGCWYEAETVPQRQQSVRQKDKIQREGVVLRAKNQQYFCDIEKAEEFGKLLWATGCAVGADRTRLLVFICDGALWIWNLIGHYFPNAIQIVDWYHAVDRLKRIAEEAFSNAQERQAWLENSTEDLWQARVEAVIEACQHLAKKSNLAKQSLLYYANNMERMRYAQFRAAGYLIGSGVIESGCKQIVAQRLKLPGAQWNVEGAVLTAKARTAWMSGNWHKLVSARSLLPLAA
ncbi:MAG: ISKra4 family transposase [Geobacteraceae bacterium]|nr:MAG: ISKra4 family transposase [Geobacteraceae bacterium]